MTGLRWPPLPVPSSHSLAHGRLVSGTQLGTYTLLGSRPWGRLHWGCGLLPHTDGRGQSPSADLRDLASPSPNSLTPLKCNPRLLIICKT